MLSLVVAALAVELFTRRLNARDPWTYIAASVTLVSLYLLSRLLTLAF